MSYGNGTSVKYDYDILDRVEKIWYKESGASQKAHQKEKYKEFYIKLEQFFLDYDRERMRETLVSI